jgi:hypothetical protein
MAKSKLSAPKVIVKGFRVDKGHSAIVRFVNEAPDITDINLHQPHAISSDRIEVLSPVEPVLSTAIEFNVVLKDANLATTMPRIRPVIVEISSGQRRYRETIFPEIRRQTLRYHLFYEEPSPNLLLCPRHGLVRPVKGRCPDRPPHV